MISTILHEYQNQNENRKYPFDDNSTLLDANGVGLPVDFIIDACLYPINAKGDLYISKIDTANKTIYINDGNQTIGIAEFKLNDLTSIVYETEKYHRQIGVLVFGSGVYNVFVGDTIRIFNNNATKFTSSVIFGLKQHGVRAFILPDGSMVCGDVIFEGRDGVIVTTRTQNGENILRIDVVGVEPPDMTECADTGPVITAVVVENTPESCFAVSKYSDSVVSIIVDGIDLDDLCEQYKNRRIPSITQNESQQNIEPREFISIRYNASELNNGNLLLIAPSTSNYKNPISIMPLQSETLLTRMTTDQTQTLEEVEQQAKEFTNPNITAGGIKISIRGIGSGQLPE